MKQNNKEYDELVDAVIEQLKKQHYMESALALYKRLYRRIGEHMELCSVCEYSPEIGQDFLGRQKVSTSTRSFYSCVVRRLDDYLERKDYRYHHGNASAEVCPEYSELLSDYLASCIKNGNKPSTVSQKRAACTIFLNFLASNGYLDISSLDVGIITKSLLLYANKDKYADIRLLLRYLYENNQTEYDFSGIVPHFKRKVPIPTVYTVEEIKRIEGSIDTVSDRGIRDICILRLATRMGLRVGDIAKLKINEIDLASKKISIIQEKTGMPLELEMPADVYKTMYRHIEKQAAKNYSDEYVFHSMTAPYKRISTSAIRHTVNECIASAKIDVKGRKHGPHAFRSSLASSMIADGSSYEAVRRILGHTDPNVIKHYARTDIEKLRLCAIEPPKLNGFIKEYLSGKKVFRHV